MLCVEAKWLVAKVWQLSKPSDLMQEQKFLDEIIIIFRVFGMSQKFFW